LAQPTLAATIRPARRDDLAAILALIGADPISSSRAGHSAEVTPEVEAAFAAIDTSNDHYLLVVDEAGEVVGTLQLSLLPGLSRNGMRRALIESVHVRADRRNHGLGAQLVRHALDLARHHGCGMAQLTSDKRRVDAHRFYARLGFIASHEGMKLVL